MEKNKTNKEKFNLLPKVISDAIKEACDQKENFREWDDHTDYSDHSDSGYSIWSDNV